MPLVWMAMVVDAADIGRDEGAVGMYPEGNVEDGDGAEERPPAEGVVMIEGRLDGAPDAFVDWAATAVGPHGGWSGAVDWATAAVGRRGGGLRRFCFCFDFDVMSSQKKADDS